MVPDLLHSSSPLIFTLLSHDTTAQPLPESLRRTTDSLSARPAFVFLFLTFSFPLGTTRTRQDLTGTLTVRRRTAAGGVWELAVGTDSTVELAAGDVLEVADGTTLRAMLVCPGRFPDTAAEPMDLSAVEKLAVCCSLARAFVFVKLLCFHRRQKS